MTDDDSPSLQQHQLRRRHPHPPPPNFLVREEGRPRLGVKNGVKVGSTIPPPPPPLSSSSQCTIVLEERKDVPVFWDGENPVPLMEWVPVLGNSGVFTTIEEFLSTYVAGNYLRKCSMSLEASNTKYINNLRMGDPFAKILDYQNKAGKAVTLMLNQSSDGNDAENSGYSKFTLHIREMHGKRVLWNGTSPTNKMTAKLHQADMNLTIGKCLMNYVAGGYLSENCQVDRVEECKRINRKLGEVEFSTVPMDATMNSLFTGNSASIAIRNTANIKTEPEGGTSAKDNNCPRNPHQSNSCGGAQAALDDSSSSSTAIPFFRSERTSSHWKGWTWLAIREEVGALVTDVELTMRDTIMSTETYYNLVDKRGALETAVRRRTRVVDEIWHCFTALQSAYMDVLNSNTVTEQAGTSSSILSLFETPRHSSHSIVPERPASSSGFDGDSTISPAAGQLDQRLSCLDLLSATLIRYGMELELFDEQATGLNRLAGVGLGMAVLVAICTVVLYF